MNQVDLINFAAEFIVGFLIRSVPRASIVHQLTTVNYTWFPWKAAVVKYEKHGIMDVIFVDCLYI